MTQQSTNTDLLSDPSGSQNRIFKQAMADAVACPIRMYGKSAENYDWNGIGHVAPHVSRRAVTRNRARA